MPRGGFLSENACFVNIGNIEAIDVFIAFVFGPAHRYLRNEWINFCGLLITDVVFLLLMPYVILACSVVVVVVVHCVVSNKYLISNIFIT